MIVDGMKIAAALLADARASLPSGVTPVVRAIVVQPTAATESYLRIKEESAAAAGMHLEIVRVGEEVTDEDIIAALLAGGADAVLVQLPLPERFDTAKILAAIPLLKDADVLSDAAYVRFEKGEPDALIPPVASAVRQVLKHASVPTKGKRAVVVGRGRLVGKPVAALLGSLGAHVSVIHRATENPDALLVDADIVVSGIGIPRFITEDKVKEGVVLIDAGTSGERGGVAGDIDPACAPKASVFTRVPGGVGPIAVACLFKNAAALVNAAP
ncbi:MAG: bifunctional 5,10-methylenetetrahydrofolate dehydrogenase/5,10-methenyltetrahydrofolate cyclohydrolase [Minisyncoccia bacterium]